MFPSESINVSSGVGEPVNSSNTANISEILLILDKNKASFQHPNMMRLFTLCLIVFILEIGHLFAIGQHAFTNRSSCIFKRIELRFLTLHALFIGISVGFVTLAQVSFEADERMFYCSNSCQFVNNLRVYFLTLSSYMLVTFVFICYSIVVKPLFLTPVPFPKLASFVVLFYALSSIPSFILAALQHLSDINTTSCIPYPFTTMQFSGTSERIGMVIVLIVTYIIPLGLVVFIFIKILNNLQAKSSQNKHSVSDANFVRMTSMMSLAFIISNTPLVLQEIVIIFFDSSLVNPNLVIFVEICSVMNICINPCIYLWIDCKYSHWDCQICSMSVETVSNNNERGLYKCCYEPVSNDGTKGCLIKPIDIPVKK